MKTAALIATAAKNLRRSKVRTVLSLLGIVIGVFSVTLIVSLGLGLRAFVTGEVSAFGNDYVSVQPKTPGLSSRGSLFDQSAAGSDSSLTADDLDALARIPYVEAVQAGRTAQAVFSNGSKTMTAVIYGTSATYLEFDKQSKMDKGRFFTENEEKSSAQVAVIGASAARRLFGDEDPIGKKMRSKELSVTVIGTFQKRGAAGFFDFDSIVVMPVGLVDRRLARLGKLTEMNIKVGDPALLARAEADISRIMRRRHGITDPAKDDFQTITSESVLTQIRTVTGAITALLGFLSAISLLVGGIGIMTIMLVSVTERIREVGLRKALGAKNGEIQAQFLAESVVLTTAGGVIGGALAVLATIGLVFAARSFGFQVPFVISLPAFGAAALVSAAIGIIFGIYPARKAARVDPITSLRSE
jgi:putative ABC transport system permease protein